MTKNNNPLYLGMTVEFGDGSQDYSTTIANGRVGWYTPRTYLRELANVVRADYIETSSSAGDWSGWYAVRVAEDRIEIVSFAQENLFPRATGYVLQTGDAPFAVVSNEADIDEAVNDYVRYLFGDYDDDFDGEDE